MRIIAIDYGLKRTGIAWTDPLKIIATGLGSFDTPTIPQKLQDIARTEGIEAIVLGMPTHLDGSDTDSTAAVRRFHEWLTKTFPTTPILLRDERFTSKLAKQAMIDGGLKRKQRQDKHLVNELSATILLQNYMQEL